jgi:hypothetical protein
MIGGDTHGRARLTPTETAQAVARSRNMPIFNTRTGCADRGETCNHDNHFASKPRQRLAVIGSLILLCCAWCL